MANKMDEKSGRVYVLLGDGELQEGLVWEVAMSSAHYKLDNLVAIIDWNGLQIDGKNDDVMTVKPIDKKFESFGWNVISIDGHNIGQIIDALDQAREFKGKPTAIIAKTIKGKGVSFMEDIAGWHGKAPNDEEAEMAVKELGGLGSAVTEVVSQNYPVKMELIGQLDTYGESGKPEELKKKYGMNADAVAAACRRLLNK